MVAEMENAALVYDWKLFTAWELSLGTVSYTHLTLPTICSV